MIEENKLKEFEKTIYTKNIKIILFNNDKNDDTLMFINNIDLLNPDMKDLDDESSLRSYLRLFVCLCRLKKYGYSIFSDKILNEEEQKRYFSYAMQLNTEREAFPINTQSLYNIDNFFSKSFNLFYSFKDSKKDNLIFTNSLDNESFVLTYEIPINPYKISFDAICSLLVPKKNNKYTLFFDKSKKYEVEANENKIIHLEDYIQTVLKQNITFYIVIKKENLEEWTNLKIKMQVLMYDTGIRNLIIREMMPSFLTSQ